MNCNNCGAALPPASGPQVLCPMCGASNQAASNQAASPGQPLPQWQAPPGAMGQGPPMGGPPMGGPPMGGPPMGMQFGGKGHYGGFGYPMVRVKVSKSWMWIVFSMLIVTLVTTIPFFMMSGAFAPGWDGDEPFECGLNDRYEIEDVKADFDGVAMEIGGNCQVELRDVDIKGETAVKIRGNGRLTMHSGTLEGEDVGVDVSGNGRVKIHDGEVKGGDYAIDADINADVDTGDAEIDGKLKTNMNARIDGKKH